MSMFISNNLCIDVADSDVQYNRRLSSTSSKSFSETRSYYTNDDPIKKTEIFDWFNNFDVNNKFFVDVKKMKQYITIIKENVLPYRNQFHNNLENYEMDIADFNMKFNGEFVKIPNMMKTGDDFRYLKFENGDNLIKIFRKLILGRLTKIVVTKELDRFNVYLELDKGYEKLLNIIDDSKEEPQNDSNEKVVGGYNKIYYGTPGCGKSHFVKDLYEVDDNLVHRTTFYSDYSNTDFVGQILPVIEGSDVVYRFNPGVFTQALYDSLINTNKKVVLVVEEINRGNAPAIFGDIFQLLDRDENGESKYKVRIPQIEKWLQQNGLFVDYITLPSNLFVIATMNTSDQNVFTLDTAFKRRWSMEYISNKFKDKEPKNWFDWYIPGSKITWRKFVENVNDKIKDNHYTGYNLEDKRLGVYFIGPNDLVEHKEFKDNDLSGAAKSFAFKVLMYIWEDVAKINRDEWFEGFSSLDDIIDVFLDNNKDTSSQDSLNILKGIFEEL